MATSPENWERVKTLFEEALEREPEQRSAYLQENAGDQATREEVERLLAEHKQAGGFLSSPAFEAAQHQPNQSEHRFLPGAILAERFRIIRFIAAGGMGEVYAAQDLELRENLAIKTIKPEILRQPNALERFKREVHLARKVTHPNVCRVFDLFRHIRDASDSGGEAVFVSMELLHGETLSQRIRRSGSLEPDVALTLIKQIASGLAAAHYAGVVHRDFKPSNVVLVPDGDSGQIRAVITDFGLAIRSGGDPPLTTDFVTAHGVFGTPAYMAPEQIEGHDVTSASDIYALGLVIHEMVTGALPFGSETPLSMVVRRVHEPVPSPRLLTPNLDIAWESAILRCLSREPSERFRTAEEVVWALEGESTSHEQQRVVIPKLKIWRRVAIAGVTALVVALSLGGWFLFSRNAHALSETDTIVLTDFANKTGDNVFDDTLRQGLAVQLEQSPFLRVVSEGRMRQTLRFMGQSADAPLTPEISRDLCQRLGSKAYLSATISNLGSQYVIGLNAVNCRTGEFLAREQVTAATKEHVLKALDSAVAKLRGRLGESLSTVQKFDTPLEQATTPSLEALQAYTLGAKAGHGKGDFAASVPYFQRAIELDGNFAMAYAALGTNYANLGEQTKAIANVRKAFELRDRVSKRENFYISCFYYTDVTGDLEKALKAYQIWAETYPREVAAFGNLSYISSQLGRYDEALSSAQAVLRLLPNGISYDALMASHMFLNRFDEAKATAAEAQSHHFDSPLSHLNLYLIAFVESDAAAMAHEAAAVRSTPGHEDNILSYEALTAAYLGEFTKARELSKRAASSAQHAGNMEAAATHLADVALQDVLVGNTAMGKRGTAAALAVSRGQDAKETAALAYAFAGDAVQSEALAKELANEFPEGTVVQSIVLPMIRALNALGSGNAVRAIEILQTAAPYDLANASQTYPAYTRGLVYLSARNGQAAAAEFQKILDHRGVVPNTPVGALARLGLARAYAAQGDTAKSKAAYQYFLTLWKDADPDIPIFQSAKNEFAKLK